MKEEKCEWVEKTIFEHIKGTIWIPFTFYFTSCDATYIVGDTLKEVEKFKFCPFCSKKLGEITFD